MQTLISDLESQFACNGICTKGAFYYFKDVAGGPPTSNCLTALKTVFNNKPIAVGVILLITCFLMGFSNADGSLMTLRTNFSYSLLPMFVMFKRNDATSFEAALPVAMFMSSSSLPEKGFLHFLMYERRSFSCLVSFLIRLG